MVKTDVSVSLMMAFLWLIYDVNDNKRMHYGSDEKHWSYEKIKSQNENIWLDTFRLSMFYLFVSLCCDYHILCFSMQQGKMFLFIGTVMAVFQG